MKSLTKREKPIMHTHTRQGDNYFCFDAKAWNRCGPVNPVYGEATSPVKFGSPKEPEREECECVCHAGSIHVVGKTISNAPCIHCSPKVKQPIKKHKPVVFCEVCGQSTKIGVSKILPFQKKLIKKYAGRPLI